MRRYLSALVLLGLFACQRQLYGSGHLYLHNGTEQPVRLRVEGRTATELDLRAGSGRLVEDAVAGPYQIVVIKQGKVAGGVPLEVSRDRLTIFNLDGAGCFARADIAGMYNKNLAPVRLLQTYTGAQVIVVPEELGVMPGEPPPRERPKSAFAFQRLAVVPCDLARQDWSLEDYMQRLR